MRAHPPDIMARHSTHTLMQARGYAAKAKKSMVPISRSPSPSPLSPQQIPYDVDVDENSIPVLLFPKGESRPVREKSERVRKASLIKRPGNFLRVSDNNKPPEGDGGPRRSLYQGLSKEPMAEAEADSFSGWCSLQEPDPPEQEEEGRRGEQLGEEHGEEQGEQQEEQQGEQQEEQVSEVPTAEPEGQMHDPCCGLWVAELSQIGYKPSKPGKAVHTNQDTTVVSWSQGGHPQEHLFSVLDGHGRHGHIVAASVKSRLPATISRLAQRNPDHASVLQQGYEAVNMMIRKDPDIDDTLSGTTAASVWFSGRRAFVANTGDSRIVLGCASISGQIVATDLTEDQTPFRSDERRRVIKAGARVMTIGELHGECGPLSPNKYSAEDPPRCYLQKKSMPGAAFTRSIGDAMAESIGVISTPEVRVHTVSDNDRFMILATDGVWEFLSSQEAVDVVQKCNSPFEAALKLIEESYKLWMEFDDHTDDISVVVIFFQHQLC